MKDPKRRRRSTRRRDKDNQAEPPLLPDQWVLRENIEPAKAVTGEVAKRLQTRHIDISSSGIELDLAQALSRRPGEKLAWRLDLPREANFALPA